MVYSGQLEETASVFDVLDVDLDVDDGSPVGVQVTLGDDGEPTRLTLYLANGEGLEVRNWELQ